MLLLHGGSYAYCSGLLVLQHVSEALEVGGKKREEVKEGDRGYTEEEEEAGFPHQVISHVTDVATHTLLALLSCKTYVPPVGTHFLSQSNDKPELLILEFSMCFQTSTRRQAK